MSLQRLHFVNMYKAFNMAPGPGKHSLSNIIICALSALLTSCVMCIDHSPRWGGDVLCVGHQGGDPHSVCVTARLGSSTLMPLVVCQLADGWPLCPSPGSSEQQQTWGSILPVTFSYLVCTCCSCHAVWVSVPLTPHQGCGFCLLFHCPAQCQHVIIGARLCLLNECI